jgi:hypothetical protein
LKLRKLWIQRKIKKDLVANNVLTMWPSWWLTSSSDCVYKWSQNRMVSSASCSVGEMKYYANKTHAYMPSTLWVLRGSQLITLRKQYLVRLMGIGIITMFIYFS